MTKGNTSSLVPTMPQYRALVAYLPLEYMSWDLKGPITPPSIAGHRYAAIATCRSTRKRFGFFLAHKSDVADKIDELRLIISTLGGRMQFIKSDNGGEFVSATLRRYFLEHAIMVETTSPHTPSQNGVAERTNRTVCESAVAMMLAANVPHNLWSYAIQHAIYLLDRLPTKATHMATTAFVETYGYIPDISHLRTFGCDAFAYIQEGQRTSFGPRAEKGLMLGYDESSLGYLFYLPRKKRVYVTGHITFNEVLSEKK